MSNPWKTEVTIELQQTKISTLLRNICCECTVNFKWTCFFCFKNLTGLKFQHCFQLVQVFIQTQFSLDIRACNLPSLPEITFVDLRLTTKLKKNGVSILSRVFRFSKSQKFFPDTDIIFSLLSLYFASLPQSRWKFMHFICGTCLSWKCSITERSTDFSCNPDFFEKW